MASQWDTWLRALAAAGKGGIRLEGASRGRAFTLLVHLAGSWTGATMRGDVRIRPDAAAALSVFTVTGPVVANGYSTFTCTLAAGTGANSTGVLPADTDLDGVEEFPFDLLLTPSGGTEELLLGGVLPVTGRIIV